MKYRDVLEATTRSSTLPISKCNNAVAGVSHKSKDCPQLPGTVLRIFIPAGAAINLLNFIELSSPGGICIILRLPFLSGLLPGEFSVKDLAGIFDSIKRAGGKIEVLPH
jgi:hypothetical protein